MSVVRPLLAKLAGLLVGLYPLVLAILSLAVNGWRKTFSVKERPLPPAKLEDPKWGEHK
jgi:hypothetical protein